MAELTNHNPAEHEDFGPSTPARDADRSRGEDASPHAPDEVVASASTYVQPALPAALPQHPFYRIPAELILAIIDLLPPESFINFAFAIYPLVRAHDLAPVLSRHRVDYVTKHTQIPALFPLLTVPPELMLQIIQHLKPIDVMRFVIANYRELARQGIAPSMTRETEAELKRALRKLDAGD